MLTSGGEVVGAARFHRGASERKPSGIGEDLNIAAEVLVLAFDTRRGCRPRCARPAGQWGSGFRPGSGREGLRLRQGCSGPLEGPSIVGPAVQQAGEEVQGFDRHVAGGRVGKHVGSLQRMVFWRFPSWSRALRHVSPRPAQSDVAAQQLILVRKPH